MSFYSRIPILKSKKSRKEMEKDDLGRLGGITMFDINSIYKSYNIQEYARSEDYEE
jgi:hypothetical protein